MDLLLEKDGHQLLVQGRAYDDGAAFRMQLLGEGPVSVIEETCGFCVPEEAHSISGMKLVMSYEDHYHPIPFEDLYQNNYAFPMLCDLGGGAWALYAEAAVFGDYGGSNLHADGKKMPRSALGYSRYAAAENSLAGGTDRYPFGYCGEQHPGESESPVHCEGSLVYPPRPLCLELDDGEFVPG